MAIEGYDYAASDFARLLIARHYPERTDHESALIRDFLREHLEEFERVSFSVRLGAGVEPAGETDPGVRRAFLRATQRRIDLVAWQAGRPVLVEVKTRVGHAVLGQLLSDRQLWLEERPEDPDPRLVAVGRSSTPDDVRILNGHGVDVFLYDEA